MVPGCELGTRRRRSSAAPARLRGAACQAGVTLVELLVVLVVLGILGATVAPRLSTSDLDNVRFHQETVALLRHAQKSAIAQRRNVCVAFTATAATATISNAFGGACSAPLAGPDGISPYAVSAKNNAGYGAMPAAITFDARGVPSNPQAIAIAGMPAIVVESGSGYVH